MTMIPSSDETTAREQAFAPMPIRDFNRLLATGPLASLLSVLDEQQGVGWILKDGRQLRYLAFKGSLPHADKALVDDARLEGGLCDADLFDRHQAAVLRVSDMRALQQSRPSIEDHLFETRLAEPGEGVREWRAWRLAVADPAGPELAEGQTQKSAWLLTVWVDRGRVDRHEEQLRHAQRQIHAQQALISQLRSELPSTAAEGSLVAASGWSEEPFKLQLRREVDLSRREHRNLAVLLVEPNLSGMSPAAASAAVDMLAVQLSRGTRSMDTVARIGPNRFGVLLSGAALTPAYSRAEALRRDAGVHIAAGEGEVQHLSLAIGVAAYPHNASEPGDLLIAARAALVEAVDAGSGVTVVARVVLGKPPSAAEA